MLNTPSPRPNTDFGISQTTVTPNPFAMLQSSASPFFNPPVGIATPLTPLSSMYSSKKKGSDSNGDHSDIPQDLSQHNENEFEMFGKLIASQLRKLPLSLALDTQLKIQTLVNAARIQAVYQQYSYAGPSQEALSVQALSNGILTSMVSQSNPFSSNAIELSNDTLDLNKDLKSELPIGSPGSDLDG